MKRKKKKPVVKNPLLKYRAPWDTIDMVAKHLNISASLLSKWHERGYVPPGRHYYFVGAAKQLGYSLTHKQLAAQHKRAKRKREERAALREFI